jgi:hypothetical protein
VARSIRQRGKQSWEIRAFAGKDAETGKKRYVTRTVRGAADERAADALGLPYCSQRKRREPRQPTLRSSYKSASIAWTMDSRAARSSFTSVTSSDARPRPTRSPW